MKLPSPEGCGWIDYAHGSLATRRIGSNIARSKCSAFPFNATPARISPITLANLKPARQAGRAHHAIVRRLFSDHEVFVWRIREEARLHRKRRDRRHPDAPLHSRPKPLFEAAAVTMSFRQSGPASIPPVMKEVGENQCERSESIG